MFELKPPPGRGYWSFRENGDKTLSIYWNTLPSVRVRHPSEFDGNTSLTSDEYERIECINLHD